MHRILRAIIYIVFLLTFNNSIYGEPDSLILRKGLVIKLELGDDYNILSPDPVAAAILTDNFDTPGENDSFEFNGKNLGIWKSFETDENGWLRDDSLTNSYVYYNVKSEKNQIILVEAMGNTSFYINGSARSGNPYRYNDTYESWAPRFDYSIIPVKLKKGSNDLLFKCNRGLLKVLIRKDVNGILFNDDDLTIPNLIVDENSNTLGAISLINATENFYTGLFIKTWAENSAPEYYPVNDIMPLSIFKSPFYIKLPAFSQSGGIKFNLELIEKQKDKEKVITSAVIELVVVNAGDTHKETFISALDGSVQYYAVNPPVNLKREPALFLSLHGAGVEAINQAQAYGHKNWGYIVAPTNRRPYGYNWENWGRIDALEVLDISKSKFNIDPERVYLTGHSMGGHGTWHLAFNYPDKFAAFGPSAGWITIWSYRIRPIPGETSVNEMLMRSAKQSDTYAFTENLKPNGIYIIHGDADDNVPPSQAESIVENLSKFHKDFVYHLEPGAGHWWDNSDEPGADCVDWLPMFDFFAHHSVANNDQVKSIDFTTANPAISSKNYWIEIINQSIQQKISRIQIALEFGLRKFTGTAENIDLFSVDASMLTSAEPVSIQIDNQLISDIKIPRDNKIHLQKFNEKWEVCNPPDLKNKYPGRCGNLREAFNHNVLFVYSTHGSGEENNWALEKARLDAENVWYRGNSSIQIIKDDEFDPVKFKDRNVILFGNSKTNSAWKKLLSDSPIQVDNKKISVGNKIIKGDNLACLMIRPRTDSDFASVGVICGTGIEGMNLANIAPYFDQYLGFPDVVIYNTDVINSGDAGVKCIGYFGNDWSLDKGELIIK